VLASASTARRDVLLNAGLDILVDPADLDEAAFKNSQPGLLPARMAPELAVLKALAVSARRPGVMVIGADQTMECGGASYDKPADMETARRHLKQLCGRTHTLHSAVSVALDGSTLWSYVGDARMTMRDFDDTFLQGYLEQSGDEVLSSTGCYRLEGLGSHLFSRIEGDFFTVLGLPLLPLLEFLREVKFLH